jgi:hypothetical protein
LTKLVDLDLDVVLTFDGWNDFVIWDQVKSPSLLGVNGWDQIESEFRSLNHSSAFPPVERMADIYRALFPKLSHKIMNSRLWPNWNATPSKKSVDLSVAAEAFARNIIKMNTLSKGFQYNFMCVLQPDRGHNEKYRNFRNIAKSYFEKEGLKYLDLNDLEHEKIRPERFMDEVHLDALGNKLVAEIVAKKLVNDRILFQMQNRNQ